MNISELLAQFLQAELHIAGSTILWREIVGNGFGLASAILGMKRRVAAWPVGIIGNIVLFTVFLGGVFNTPNDLNLYGQAGRQVFFLIVSIYGWVRWAQFKKSHGGEGVGVRPKCRRIRPAAAADRRGRDDHRLLLHPQGAGLLGPASGRVDPYRLDSGDVRNGPWLGRILVSMDQFSGRAVAVAGPALPVGSCTSSTESSVSSVSSPGCGSSAVSETPVPVRTESPVR